MGFYENSYRIRDGAILLYTRPDRKKVTYQAGQDETNRSGRVRTGDS